MSAEGQPEGPDGTTAAAALQARIDELERSNAELERFAAVAAHDLQAPLRVVAGLVGMLGRRYAGTLDAQADELIARTVGAVERMQQLTDDLLTHARSGADTTQPPAPVDTAAVVAEVLDTLGPLVAEAGVTVEVHPLPTVVGHRVLLVQLFQNLVTNAVKFATGDRPHVRIGASRDGDRWRFTVQDDGIGIPPEARERVFEPFERGAGAADRAPGSGLGLAVCRRIVERHGGTIHADEAPGGGTVMTFTLPAVDAPA